MRNTGDFKNKKLEKFHKFFEGRIVEILRGIRGFYFSRTFKSIMFFFKKKNMCNVVMMVSRPQNV